MAHTLSPSTSHARLRSYCVQVEAGLEAVPELAGQAEAWRSVREEVVAHRAVAEAGNDGLVKARAVHRVHDTTWDARYTEGSGLAYLLANKDAKKEPYATVFRVTARRATALGHTKSTAVGARALAEAQRAGRPELDLWAGRFADANAALEASGRAMEAAEEALDDPRFGKRALVRRLNALVATTEAQILTTFPGATTLSEAILVPSWERKRSRRAEDDADADEADTDTDTDDQPA